MSQSCTSRDPDPPGVRSVERALTLLERLAASGGANLSRLACDARLSISTCHRLLTTLQGYGFVSYDRRSRTWTVGHRALAVGASFANTRDIVRIARPIMARAARESGEIVNLGAASGDRVLFLHRIDSRAPRTVGSTTMSPIPVHCSSVGKAILAQLHEREIQDFITRPLAACTENSITRPNQLLTDLRNCGRRGFAIDDEENTVGLRCVAAPIFDEFYRPIAAISIAASAKRCDDGQIAVFGRIVAAAARDTTAACGGMAPSSV